MGIEEDIGGIYSRLGLLRKDIEEINMKFDKLLPDDKPQSNRAEGIKEPIQQSDSKDITGLTAEEAHKKRDLDAAGKEKLSKRGVHNS